MRSICYPGLRSPRLCQVAPIFRRNIRRILHLDLTLELGRFLNSTNQFHVNSGLKIKKNMPYIFHAKISILFLSKALADADNFVDIDLALVLVSSVLL